VDPKAKPWDDDREDGEGGVRNFLRTLSINMIVLAMVLLGVAVGVTACGKKGDPTLPSGQKDNYPASYPQSSEPQTGVFSG
jgi:predicted small lipoprotein YifL